MWPEVAITLITLLTLNPKPLNPKWPKTLNPKTSPVRWLRTHPCLKLPSSANIGALMIRTGFWGYIFYYYTITIFRSCKLVQVIIKSRVLHMDLLYALLKTNRRYPCIQCQGGMVGLAFPLGDHPSLAMATSLGAHSSLGTDSSLGTSSSLSSSDTISSGSSIGTESLPQKMPPDDSWSSGDDAQSATSSTQTWGQCLHGHADGRSFDSTRPGFVL